MKNYTNVLYDVIAAKIFTAGLCSLFLIVCMGLRGGSSGSKGFNHKEDFN